MDFALASRQEQQRVCQYRSMGVGILAWMESSDAAEAWFVLRDTRVRVPRAGDVVRLRPRRGVDRSQWPARRLYITRAADMDQGLAFGGLRRCSLLAEVRHLEDEAGDGV